MRSKLDDKGTNFEDRCYVRLCSLYRNLHIQSGKLSNLRGDGCIKQLIRALKTLNVLTTKGNTKSLVYIWKPNIKCDRKLANQAATVVREFRRLHYPTRCNEAVITDELDTKDWIELDRDMEAEGNNVSVALPVGGINFVNYTDVQLWDELKARGYSIQDNRLCKFTYLS